MDEVDAWDVLEFGTWDFGGTNSVAENANLYPSAPKRLISVRPDGKKKSNKGLSQHQLQELLDKPVSLRGIDQLGNSARVVPNQATKKAPAGQTAGGVAAGLEHEDEPADKAAAQSNRKRGAKDLVTSKVPASTAPKTKSAPSGATTSTAGRSGATAPAAASGVVSVADGDAGGHRAKKLRKGLTGAGDAGDTAAAGTAMAEDNDLVAQCTANVPSTAQPQLQPQSNQPAKSQVAKYSSSPPQKQPSSKKQERQQQQQKVVAANGLGEARQGSAAKVADAIGGGEPQVAAEVGEAAPRRASKKPRLSKADLQQQQEDQDDEEEKSLPFSLGGLASAEKSAPGRAANTKALRRQQQQQQQQQPLEKQKKQKHLCKELVACGEAPKGQQQGPLVPRNDEYSVGGPHGGDARTQIQQQQQQQQQQQLEKMGKKDLKRKGKKAEQKPKQQQAVEEPEAEQPLERPSEAAAEGPVHTKTRGSVAIAPDATLPHHDPQRFRPMAAASLAVALGGRAAAASGTAAGGGTTEPAAPAAPKLTHAAALAALQQRNAAAMAAQPQPSVPGDDDGDGKEGTAAVASRLGRPGHMAAGMAAAAGRKAVSGGGASFLDKMRAKLAGGRFRYLNEELYTCSGGEAFAMMQSKPELFTQYHEGFQRQTRGWPKQPVDVAIGWLRSRRSEIKEVADFGCGDARIAASVPQTVHSFDLVASAPGVTACNMSAVPLPDEAVDAAIFSLALMGTDYGSFLEEAVRVLRPKGWLWIAEVRSRFARGSGDSDADGSECDEDGCARGGASAGGGGEEDFEPFLSCLKHLGLRLVSEDAGNKMFVVWVLRKGNGGKARGKRRSGGGSSSGIPWPELKACVYKKR